MTKNSNPSISKFNSVMNSQVSGQCSYAIPTLKETGFNIVTLVHHQIKPNH